jgi:hypothetical protein
MQSIDLSVRISLNEAIQFRHEDVLRAVEGMRRDLALRNVYRRLREEPLDGRTALELVEAVQEFRAPAA